MITRPVIVLVLVAIVTQTAWADMSRADLLSAFQVGLSNIERETIDGAATVDQGTVPAWLNGDFLRHSCGAFGETEFRDESQPNFIGHLFDCIEIGSKFRLVDGNVTFTNRWFDTSMNDVYNYYDRDMNESSVFNSGTFSKCNASQVDRWEANMTRSDKITDVPHVSWWKIGSDVIAMTENPPGVVIDPTTMEQKGETPFADKNMGLPANIDFTNTPAHEQTEPDGTLWSATVGVRFTSQTTLTTSRLVYRVGADKVRRVIGTYPYPEVDLTRCSGPYPDMSSRFGYLHSFAMTENFIILPETAYMFDPCFYARYNKHEPFFPQAFRFESAGFTRLLVMNKTDGQFLANLTTIPLFVTHQLGAYEEGDFIHMDMLTYDTAEIYTRVTYVNELLSGAVYSTNVTRITINMTDGSVTLKDLRQGKPPVAFEMSSINYAYNARKYTYGYMTKNFDRPERNAITKLNVDTGVETEYQLAEGLFVQEPHFYPRPGGVIEDDGVIMAQGVDGIKKKAFLVIVDAKTMKLVAHVTAPDIALFGLHGRFFPLVAGPVGAAPIPFVSWLAIILATLIHACM